MPSSAYELFQYYLILKKTYLKYRTPIELETVVPTISAIIITGKDNTFITTFHTSQIITYLLIIKMAFR